MCFASLSLQAMLLVGVDGTHPTPSTCSLPGPNHILRDMLMVLFHSLLVHCVKGVQGQLDVADEGIASTLAEVFTDNDTHELELFGVWSLCGV